MSEIVKVEADYKLTEQDKVVCFEHLHCGYNPSVTYHKLWYKREAPITFGEFLEQYADLIVATTAGTADRWRVALGAELRQRQAELDASARELRAALATLAESPLPEGSERDAQLERQCAVTAHYGRGFQITAALAAVTRELRALRKGQLDEAAAIVGMLAVNANARGGVD